MTQGMPLKAFHGDAKIRSEALERLISHDNAAELTSGLLFQGGGKFSPAAALVDVAEAAAWQERTGLAAWVAYAIDTLGNMKSAVETTTAILEAIAVGVDTTRIGSAVIEVALTSLDCKSEALREARDEILALHGRALSGDAPSNAQWRAARKRATEVADSATDDVEKAVAACVEAAAWSPEQAPTSVAEVLRAWMRRLNVDAQLGWDEVRHAKTKEKLGEMHKRFIENNPDEKRDVFKLLEEHDPQWSKDIRDLIAGQSRVALEQGGAARDLLTQVLRSAK